MSLIHRGHKISAEVKLYDWYNIDDKGNITTSQGELLDAGSMKIVQWNIFNKETGEEEWLDGDMSIEKVKERIDYLVKEKE